MIASFRITSALMIIQNSTHSLDLNLYLVGKKINERILFKHSYKVFFPCSFSAILIHVTPCLISHWSNYALRLFRHLRPSSTIIVRFRTHLQNEKKPFVISNVALSLRLYENNINLVVIKKKCCD